MKKHIFGFTLFSAIIVSFGFIFAYFYAPVIPEVLEISRIEVKNEKPYSCRMRRQNVSFEVLNSQYLFDEGKIITKIRLKANPYLPNPEKVFVTTTFDGAENFNSLGGKYQIIENPFAESGEKIINIVTNVSSNERNQTEGNLYAKVLVTQFEGAETYQYEGLTQVKAVLFVHGKGSIIKK